MRAGRAPRSAASAATRASRVVRRAVAAASSSPRARSWCSRGSAARTWAAPSTASSTARARVASSTSSRPSSSAARAVASAADASARRWSAAADLAIRCTGATAAARRAASSRRRAVDVRVGGREEPGPLGERGLDPGASLDEPAGRLQVRPGTRTRDRRLPAASSTAVRCASAAPSRRSVVQVSSTPEAACAERSCTSQSSGSGASVASLTRLTRSATPRWAASDRRRSVDPAVPQPALDVLEPAGAEQLLEQPVPLLGPGAEERLEPALRQHRHLGELGDVHADQAGDQVAGLVEAARQRLPGAVDPLGDRDGGLLRGGARAALLGPLPRGRADDPEPASRQRRLQRHAGGGARERPGRSAAAWRRCGRRARRRTARSRRRPGRWSCRRRWRRTAGTGRRRTGGRSRRRRCRRRDRRR